MSPTVTAAPLKGELRYYIETSDKRWFGHQQRFVAEAALLELGVSHSEASQLLYDAEHAARMVAK